MRHSEKKEKEGAIAPSKFQRLRRSSIGDIYIHLFFADYGPCKYCGESDVLELDHINEDGCYEGNSYNVRKMLVRNIFVHPRSIHYYNSSHSPDHEAAPQYAA